MQNIKTNLSKWKPVLQTGLLSVLLMMVFNMPVSASDSSLMNNHKPFLTGSSACINTTLSMESVSPKVERIIWKHNGQVVHTSLTPALIRKAAGTVEGTEADEFRFPSGIALDDAGNMYIADQFNHRVQKWAPGADHGITVAGIGGQGDGADQLNYPMSVVVDAKGNLYVSDAANSRIQLFTPGSLTGITVAGGNGRGPGAGQLNMPHGICLDQQGNLYIADNYNHRIQRWSPGAKEGVTVAGGHGKGNAANQLQYPSTVKVDENGIIYIADAANDRIQAWKEGAKTGITVAGGNGRGKSMAQLYYPTDFVITRKGDLLITDQTNQRVQRWKPGATAGTTVAGGNGQGANLNQFNYPYGIVIDKEDNIYVADQYNHRIQHYQLTESATRYTFQFKATRPGTYQADIVYRNGETEISDEFEVHDQSPAAPIVAEETICTGKEYQLKIDARKGIWSSSNNSIAAVNEEGILTGKQHGTVVIAYETKDEYGCITKSIKSVTVKTTPVVPPVALAPEMVQQSGNTSFSTQQICVGSSLPLHTILMAGKYSSSDTAIARVEAGTIRAIHAGQAVISFTASAEGCIAESKTTFIVLPVADAPVIQGYNKIVTGQIRQLSTGIAAGKWNSEHNDIASIDKNGFVKGLRPGITKVSFETTDKQGCRVQSFIPVTVQPEAPVVKDASYESREQMAFIRFDQQVTAKAGVAIQFFETNTPNAKPIEPLVKNTPGTYRFWVASIENGVASQRVAFAVNITETAGAIKLTPMVMGNPSTHFFTVQLKSSQTHLPITMRIADMQGRLIEQRQALSANSTIQFGQQYAAGQYIVEWIQGTERKVLQLVKIGAGGGRAVSVEPRAVGIK